MCWCDYDIVLSMEHDRELVLYQIFFIFILPIALLTFGIIPISWRMVVLCVAMLFMYGVIQNEKISDHEMGLGQKGFLKAFIAYVVFTVAGIFFLVKLSRFFGIYPNIIWWKSTHLLFLFLPVSLLQEIAYRGFLFHKLKQLSSKWWVIIGANTVLFTILHVIYPLPQIMLPLAFFSGIGFAVIYRYFPNLILISLAHAVLNFVAILYGFFFFQS